MSCEQFREILSEYIDGELPEEHQESAAAHLQTCLDCQALLNTTRKTLALARQHGEARLSPEFRAALIRKVQAAYRSGVR